MLYGIAGRVFLIESLDEWSALAVSKLFAGWFVTPLSPNGRTPDSTIRVRCGSVAPQIPAGLDRFAVAGGGFCHTNGRTVYIELDGSLVVIPPFQSPLVDVWMRTRYDFSSWILAQVFAQAFAAALRRCGLFLLHSAGVRPPKHDNALLIAGESGSGKTTLTCQLASRGWGYLSDDSMVLASGQHGVEAQGLRRFFALTEATMAAVQLRKDSSDPKGNGIKTRLAPQDVFPAGQIASAQIGAILFPAITQRPQSRMVRLSPSDVMARLLRFCPWACYDKPTATSYLGLLGQLARQTLAFDLFSGKDLLGDPDLTVDLILAALEDR